MKDLDWATTLLVRFVLPLLTGGQAIVSVPLLGKGIDRLLRASDAGLDHSTQGQQLSEARRQVLAALGILTNSVELASDPDGLRIVATLHDTLFLQHPYGKTLSASRRAGLIQHIRRQLVIASESLPEPSPETARDGAIYQKLLLRYSLCAGLWNAKPKLGSSGSLEADVLPLVLDADDKPLARYLAHCCPLLLLLRPPPGLPLLIELIPWLQLPQVTRLFVSTQLRHGVTQALSRIGSSLLLIAQQLAEHPDALSTNERKTLWTVLSLFHLRAALMDPQPTTPPDESLRNALALYALIARTVPALALPADVGHDQRLSSRVLHYQQACSERAGMNRLSQMRERCAPLLQGL